MPTKRNQALIYRPVPGFLRDLRMRAGLTQRQLAAKLKEGAWWVERCEMGSRRVDVAEFVAWCKACRVPPEQAIDELTRRS